MYCDMCTRQIKDVEDLFGFYSIGPTSVVFFCLKCVNHKSDWEYAMTYNESTSWLMVPKHLLINSGLVENELKVNSNRSLIKWHLECNRMLDLEKKWERLENAHG